MPTPDDDHLPWSQEAEQAVIGSLLIDPSGIPLVQTFLYPSDFYDDRLGEIYRICTQLGTNLDYVSLTERLHRPEWNALVAELITAVPTSVHLEHYASIVHRDGVRRTAIKIAGEIAGKAYHCTDAEEMLAHIHSLTAALVAGHAAADRSLIHLSSAFYDTVEAWYNHPIQEGECRFLSTGFSQLDNLTDGMEPRTLTVICGRPGLGKSAVAFEIARRVGMAGHNLLMFSLEMGSPQILHRWASAMSGLPMRDAQRGRGDVVPYVNAVLKLSSCRNVWIDDTPALTPSQVRARALARHAQNPLELVVIDHGGEMMPDAGWRGNDNLAAIEGRKTKAMKDLAKELGCPVLLVLQLNRAPEGRANKRPTMSDLRDSGGHEQAADVILGLYRESYYDANAENPNVLEVSVLKNRQGPSSHEPVLLWYERECQRFRDADVAKKVIREDVL